MRETTSVDRAEAAELVYPGLFADEAERRHPGQVDRVAAALSEARAPYNRLTADLRALAEELERADELVDVAARLRAVIAANERTGE